MSLRFSDLQDTIVALATAEAVSAIGVIRLSGPQAILIVNRVFKGKNLEQQASHTLHFGRIADGDTLLDEVVVSLFKGPHSYTGQDVVEVSAHGSPYILKRLTELFIREGARPAQGGEFTLRAFLNRKMALSEAEAVAELIAADSEASRIAAMNQLRGGYTQTFRKLREELIHFASLVELELDFSEEDVEFADRSQLRSLIHQLMANLEELLQSFQLGNVVKHGVPVVIAGKPNAGKSTLLNALLKEERAIVSDIAGTTRDFVDDVISLGGLSFRFIDTAGLRQTEDVVEQMGVQRTLQKMEEAALVLYLFDVSQTTPAQLQAELSTLNTGNIPLIPVANKRDLVLGEPEGYPEGTIFLSAARQEGLLQLEARLLAQVNAGQLQDTRTLVTNARHYEALLKTREALEAALKGMDLNLSGDLLAEDIRRALYHLGEITGDITTDDLLGNIFSKFCIGK